MNLKVEGSSYEIGTELLDKKQHCKYQKYNGYNRDIGIIQFKPFY